jgi:hypothetical protein
MRDQVFVHIDKTQKEDGTWVLSIVLMDEHTNDVDRSSEWIRTVEVASKEEPQVQHLDWT